MADNPIAIRASEEVKTLFNQLAEQGNFENKGEFLSRLLTAYQSEEVKNSGQVSASLLKPAIETVETLMTRLLEVLNGTAAALTTKDEQQRQVLDEQSKSFEDTRVLLQQRITTLEQDTAADEERIQSFIEDKETAEQQAADLQKRIKELEHITEDKQAIIDEYKDKNDTLSSIANEYRAAFDENKTLLSENTRSSNKIIELELKIKTLTEKLEEMATKHTEELERLTDTLNLKHDKAVLELKMAHQQEIQEHQERYNEKTKSLLERLEKQADTARAAQPKSKTKKEATNAVTTTDQA